MPTQVGKLLKTLPLYADETLLLLRKACEKAELTNDNEGNAVPHYATTPSSFRLDIDSASEDDESVDTSGSQSSSKSSNDEEPESGEPAETEKGDGTAASLVAAVVPSDPILPQRAKPRPKKMEPNERRRAQQVNLHTSKLHRMKIPLDDDCALFVPSALLGRKNHLSLLSQCQSCAQLALELGAKQQKRPVIVLLLRSGRFIGGVFVAGTCVTHRSFQRYTVRKGQGKAQSTQDNQRRPKSMGAQLRRAGEQNLKEDIEKLILEWKEHIDRASLIFVACPKTMKTTLFASPVEKILSKDDSRIRSIPFDVGRPTFEGACVVQEVMMTIQLKEVIPYEEKDLEIHSNEGAHPEAVVLLPVREEEEPKRVAIPLTALHEAARDGNLSVILDILRKEDDLAFVDQPAGFDLMTPLHFAAESSASNVDPITAAACVSSLLLQGHADPCALDARLRLPYFLASHEKVRDAFRKSRAVLGEDFYDWEKAKVGPPLAEEDIQLRKEKEAEKKRRKKARQKEKNQKEKAEAAELEQQRQEEQERQKCVEDAKRARDSLQPKAMKSADNVCDFCQKECKGKKRLQMFKRLDYNYCSTDCVQKHKRELTAAAAMARFNN
jgi:hypothetical protein